MMPWPRTRSNPCDASEQEIQDETADDVLVPEETEEMDDAEFQADLLKSFVEAAPQTVAALRSRVQDLTACRTANPVRPRTLP
jgi:hypothetical protein